MSSTNRNEKVAAATAIAQERAREAVARVKPAAAQVKPLAKSTQDAAMRGLVRTRIWAAPRIEHTGQVLQDSVAPKVADMLSSAAHRIEPEQPRSRNWWTLSGLLVIIAGAAAAAAIAAGVKLVMVSWAIYPALDPTLPAGLSPKIVGGELRQRLGFTGVTITDALEAGALQPFGTTRNRARMAAEAGMDLIMCAALKPGQGGQARIALADAYRSGALSHPAFQAAVQRILTLKAGLRH